MFIDEKKKVLNVREAAKRIAEVYLDIALDEAHDDPIESLDMAGLDTEDRNEMSWKDYADLAEELSNLRSRLRTIFKVL